METRNSHETRKFFRRVSIFWLQGEHSWFGDYFKPNTINILQVMHDRCSVACLAPRKPWFGPRPFQVGFVVETVAPGYVFLRVSRFFTVSIIKPTFHTHIAVIYHRRYVILTNDHSVKIKIYFSLSVRQKAEMSDVTFFSLTLCMFVIFM